MSTYAANGADSDRVPWLGLIGIIAMLAGVILLIATVVIPWQDRRDARDAVREQQRLTTLHKLGFVHVTSNDFYESHYYNGPTAFVYPVGTCSIEVIIDGI